MVFNDLSKHSAATLSLYFLLLPTCKHASSHYGLSSSLAQARSHHEIARPVATVEEVTLDLHFLHP